MTIDTKYHSLDGGDTLVVERIQDVEPFLEDNKRRRADNPKGYTPSKDLMQIAHIPNVVIEQWIKLGINIFDKNDKKKIMKMLQDPNYRYLRTNEGTII